ncbi:MAG: hypothetical protein AB7S74_17905 [Hyphomicrobium sp.]
MSYNRYKHGAEAVRWLAEFLNAGARLSALVLDEQDEIRFCAHRNVEGDGEVSSYDHQVYVSLLGAEFLHIDFEGQYLGPVSTAAFDEGESSRLDVACEAGRFSVMFDAVQLSERLAPVYIMK